MRWHGVYIRAGVYVYVRVCMRACPSVFPLQSLGLAHFVWITPLQCILCVGLLWELIEVNGFCALAALTLLGIVQAWLSQKMGPHRWAGVCKKEKRKKKELTINMSTFNPKM